MTKSGGGGTTPQPTDELPRWKSVRRDAILSAAITALEDQPYDGIRIGAVARRANVAPSTLYRYFPSKELLYAAALLEWSNRTPAFAADTARTTDEEVRTWMHRVVTAFERRPYFFQALLRLSGSTDPEVHAVLAAIDEAAQAALTRQLLVLGPDLARDTAAMVRALMNAMLHSVAFGDRTMADVHRIMDHFIDLVSDRLGDTATPLG